jgi:hypothetical protein
VLPKLTRIYFAFLFMTFFSISNGQVNDELPYDKSNPISLCLIKLNQTRNDLNRRKKIKQRCLKLARREFKKESSKANQFYLLQALINQSYESNKTFNTYFSEVYNKYFFNFENKNLNKVSLRYLFKSYEDLSFYLHDDDLMKRYEALFLEIEKIYGSKKEERENILDRFIENKMWDKVESYQKKFKMTRLDVFKISNLISLEKLRRTSGKQYYDVGINGEIKLLEYETPVDYSVLIISSPNCHFSIDAMIDISKDNELLNFFTKFGLFIESQRGLLDLNDIIKWNLEHHLTPIRVVYLEKNWPSEINWEGTPTFVFFKNKKYSHSVHGWDKSLVRKSIHWLKYGKRKKFH